VGGMRAFTRYMRAVPQAPYFRPYPAVPRGMVQIPPISAGPAGPPVGKISCRPAALAGSPANP